MKDIKYPENYDIHEDLEETYQREAELERKLATANNLLREQYSNPTVERNYKIEQHLEL